METGTIDPAAASPPSYPTVSMKSGLGDRNNQYRVDCAEFGVQHGLNEVRSWRPEQCGVLGDELQGIFGVSMKSGLGDRNNTVATRFGAVENLPVSMKSGLGDRNNKPPRTALEPKSGCLNEVRSWRPEQYDWQGSFVAACCEVSMKSGLGDRNNGSPRKAVLTRDFTKVCERSASQTPATPLC